MRRQPTIAVLLCIAPVICFAQQSSHKLSDYAGTWQATFHGTPFITIKLVEKKGHLTGSASFGDIGADPNGKITNVEAPQSESPIINSRLLRFGGLELTSRGEDPNDTITVRLKLIDGKHGSLRFGDPPGGDALVLQPIAVQKIASKPSQTYPAEVHLDGIKAPAVQCTTEVPEEFGCAMLLSVDPPFYDSIDIVSVVGGESNSLQTRPVPVIREVSLILDGTLYIAVYDPPFNPGVKFSGVRRNAGIPARVDGDALIVKWPNGKEVKAKIIRRERINPNQPQPA